MSSPNKTLHQPTLEEAEAKVRLAFQDPATGPGRQLVIRVDRGDGAPHLPVPYTVMAARSAAKWKDRESLIDEATTEVYGCLCSVSTPGQASDGGHFDHRFQPTAWPSTEIVDFHLRWR